MKRNLDMVTHGLAGKLPAPAGSSYIVPKPPSDEGGGKTEGFDGGRELAQPLKDVSLADSSRNDTAYEKPTCEQRIGRFPCFMKPA